MPNDLSGIASQPPKPMGHLSLKWPPSTLKEHRTENCFREFSKIMWCVTWLESSQICTFHVIKLVWARISPENINYMTWKDILEIFVLSCNGLHDLKNHLGNDLANVSVRMVASADNQREKPIRKCSIDPTSSIRTVIAHTLFADPRQKSSNRLRTGHPKAVGENDITSCLSQSSC